MVCFTSDLHPEHSAVIRMKERPFETAEEMNKVLITNYNSVVRKDDTVYLLGDIAHRIPVEDANKLISQLNGTKILVRGNHDKQYDISLFDHIADFETVSIKGQYIALMHYPMLSWSKSHHGSIQLHGHSHGTEEDNIQNRDNNILRYDVGVDANHFYPISITRILDFFNLHS